jgi:prevent-host-death family protein
MKASESVKPISYLKTHVSEIVRDISESKKTYIITQNGEAKAILQDIKQFEQTQDSLALLKILALSTKNLKNGNYKKLDKAISDVKSKVKIAHEK